MKRRGRPPKETVRVKCVVPGVWLSGNRKIVRDEEAEVSATEAKALGDKVEII